MNAASKVAEKVMGSIPTSTTNEMAPNPTGEKMKALAWFGKYDVRLIDADKPQIVEPKDAVVRVTGTTVCGSDLHLYNAELLELKRGDILGHEFCGIVESVGSGVTQLRVGQRVVCSFQIACGSCEYCKKGLTSMCDTTNKSSVMNAMYGSRIAGIFGYGHFCGGFAGGQAEFVRVPFAENNLLPLPDGVPNEKALYLSDVVCTSYHACVTAGIEKGDSVGIWGLGPIGLLCAQWAKVMGAGRVIGIDRVDDRLEFAREKLGIETLNFNEAGSTVKALQDMCPGGLDRCIDAAAFRYAKGLVHKMERAVGLETDTSEIVNEQIMAVKKFGTIALIADYAGFTNHFNIGGVMEKGIRFMGCGQCPVQKYWKQLLDEYIIPGKFDPTDIVTHRLPFEEIVEVYSVFDDKKAGLIKVFLQTKYSEPAAAGPSLSSILQAK